MMPGMMPGLMQGMMSPCKILLFVCLQRALAVCPRDSSQQSVCARAHLSTLGRFLHAAKDAQMCLCTPCPYISVPLCRLHIFFNAPGTCVLWAGLFLSLCLSLSRALSLSRSVMHPGGGLLPGPPTMMPGMMPGMTPGMTPMPMMGMAANPLSPAQFAANSQLAAELKAYGLMARM